MDLEDFFESSLNGYLVARPDGTIVRANYRVAAWLGLSAEELAGTRFSSHLTMGGKILYETHLAPLLRMQGFFSEVALELAGTEGKRIPVFANALERKDAGGKPASVYLTLFSGEQRKKYEENLRMARDAAEETVTGERRTSALREQFIAVLGHDLRNPLGAVTMGITMLRNPVSGTVKENLLGMMERSTKRMSDLITDVMDFARGQLGDGIELNRKDVLLGPSLQHVVEELGTLGKTGNLSSEIDLPAPVNCDPVRLAQLLSNLVGNAVTHGEKGGPIVVRSQIEGEFFELSVSNRGTPIPQTTIDRLFTPFSRGASKTDSQGLGLGLYIASQIAKAHGGTLTVLSTSQETRFTFRMKQANPD